MKVLAIVLAVALLCQNASALQLAPTERAFIAHRLAAHEQTVRLWLLSRPGLSSQMAERLKSVSSDVLLLETDVDLIYADVQMTRLSLVLDWPEWTAAEVGSQGGAMIAPDGGGDAALSKRRPGLSPSPYTPLDNPYTGERATQACEFKSKHPTYDGRGVVIGGIEAVDARLPSLSYGLTLQGARVSKFLDYVMVPPVMPLLDAVPSPGQLDYGWQKTQLVTIDDDGHIGFNNRRFAAPEAARSSAGELRMTLREPTGAIEIFNRRVPVHLVVVRSNGARMDVRTPPRRCGQRSDRRSHRIRKAACTAAPRSARRTA